MQASSVILFPVSLFNHFIIESTFANYEHGEHIFSAKSLKRWQNSGGNCLVSPLVAGLVTLQLF